MTVAKPDSVRVRFRSSVDLRELVACLPMSVLFTSRPHVHGGSFGGAKGSGIIRLRTGR